MYPGLLLGNLVASSLHLVSHQGSSNAQDYSRFSCEKPDIPGNLLELGGIFSEVNMWGGKTKLESERIQDSKLVL